MSMMKPRPEAQPRTFGKLSKSQQHAVSSIVQYLDQFVASPSTLADRSSPLAQLDLHRPSNVVLIDGERGSGKTETLLTILGFWKAAFDPKDQDLQAIRSSVEKEAARNGDSKRALGIPVPVLDMQPLPRGTSLLMQLATRLYQLVEQQAVPDHAKAGAQPWFNSGDAGQTIHSAWLRLVRAVASAESEGRTGRNLAPEDLADELESCERDRGSLNECWRKFVWTVVHRYDGKLGHQGSATTE